MVEYCMSRNVLQNQLSMKHVFLNYVFVHLNNKYVAYQKNCSVFTFLGKSSNKYLASFFIQESISSSA